MNAPRTADTWFDRLPWYVDGLVCLIPGAAVALVYWFVWGSASVFALAVLAAGVLTGRYLYHRRLPQRIDAR